VTARDYAALMRERIDAWQDGSDEPARDLAAKLFKDLTETDPKLLEGWLREMAISHLAMAFHNRRGSARRRSRAQAGSTLAQYVSEFTSPDRDPAGYALAKAAMERLSTFDAKLVINDDGHTKSIGQMTGPDNLFVARKFDKSSKRDGLLSAFYAKVAERVGDRTVEDVFDVASYVELRSAITSPTTAVPAH